MVTKLHIGKTTVKMLAKLKEEMKVGSLEEVILNLIKTHKKHLSLFGTNPTLPKWNQSDRRDPTESRWGIS